jgi:hypothetical protein
MSKVIEPLKQDKKLIEYLTDDVKKVGIVFWHGIGDCVQFMHILKYLRETYTHIKIDILLQRNLGQETIFPDCVFLDNFDHFEETDYDYIFLVHFPVEGGDITKAELCCKTEIGCPPIWEYAEVPNWPRDNYDAQNLTSRLIGIHFHNTALPTVFNPSKEIAEKIWNEVLDAGYIPIEIDFQHVYHNPVNAKFDFIDCSVRRAKAIMPNLMGMIANCTGIIAVPSGPLHCAIAMKPSRVLYLEKDISIKRFTYWDIPSVNLNNYQDGGVKAWLAKLS